MPQDDFTSQPTEMTKDVQTGDYDFRRCKLCAEYAASPKYRLKKTTVYACAACGFHFINHLDSVPSEPPCGSTLTLDRKSWDYIEGRLPASETQLRQDLLLVKRHVSLTGATCLDIGAGAGMFVHLLTEAGAFAHGIEPQWIFREFARRRFGVELNGETIDARRWQQECAGHFDVVTLWDVFEHVDFPVETLRNACNVLKPGGWLFLDTPRRDALFYRICEWSYRLSSGANSRLLESLYSPLPYRHKQIFTCHQLLKLAGETGFSVTHLRSSFFQPHNKMVLVCRKL